MIFLFYFLIFILEFWKYLFYIRLPMIAFSIVRKPVFIQHNQLNTLVSQSRGPCLLAVLLDSWTPSIKEVIKFVFLISFENYLRPCSQIYDMIKKISISLKNNFFIPASVFDENVTKFWEDERQGKVQLWNKNQFRQRNGQTATLLLLDHLPAVEDLFWRSSYFGFTIWVIL